MCKKTFRETGRFQSQSRGFECFFYFQKWALIKRSPEDISMNILLYLESIKHDIVFTGSLFFSINIFIAGVFYSSMAFKYISNLLNF